MLKNYILTSLRYLLKYKAYSFINIMGFSIALVPVIFALVYISYEYSYDRYNENYNNIYRVIVDEKTGTNVVTSPITPNPLASTMKKNLPEVVYAVQLRNFSEFITCNNNKVLENDICYADPDIVNIFTIIFKYGDRKTALSSPNSILLSESMARKYFGDSNPINKTLMLGEYHQMIVKGVYKDFPDNSHFTANFIVPKTIIDGQEASEGISSNANSWGYSMFYTYIMINPKTDIESVLAKMPQLLQKYSDNNYFNQSKVYFQPLKDIHLYSNMSTELSKNGSINSVYLYALIALAILIIAVVNYINLATARSSRRTKEIAMRKIIGAERKQLLLQIIVESIIITFISFFISLIIILAAFPTINDFIERKIPVSVLLDPFVILSAVLLLVIIGICAGIYPALMISSIKPLSIFKSGNISANSKFRNALVVFQYVLSIVLIFNASLIKKQLIYLSNKDLGYEKDNIVILNVESPKTKSALETFKRELMQNPAIKSVSASVNLPNATACGKSIFWTGDAGVRSMEVNYNLVDYDFLNLYNMKLISGRAFSSSFTSDQNSSIILSEKAVKEMGLKDPIGAVIKDGKNDKQVIGVIKDFHMRSLHDKTSPFYFAIDTSATMYYLSVKVDPSDKNIIPYLRNKMTYFQPDFPFKYKYFDDIINMSYRSDQKLDTVFSVFSFFSIFVASLGIFGLVSFITDVRKKEIGIRKVTGASSWQIAFQLFKEIMKLIIISSIIAIPIAYFSINEWLNNFAYKTDINFSIFIISSMIVYIISLTAISMQVIKASAQNPVEILRYS